MVLNPITLTQLKQFHGYNISTCVMKVITDKMTVVVALPATKKVVNSGKNTPNGILDSTLK